MLSAVAFFVLLPIFLILGATQRIGVMLGRPVDGKWSERAQKRWFIGYVILTVVGFALAIAGMGNSKHFRTAHEVKDTATKPFSLVHMLIFLPRLLVS